MFDQTLLGLADGCQGTGSASVYAMTQPPVAKRIPFSRTHHGDTIIDEYAWLENKDDPAVIAHLEAENAYTEKVTSSLAKLRETLFQEIKTRTQETDLSVPLRDSGYWYYTRTLEGKQYGIHCRRKIAEGETAPPMPAQGSPLEGEEILVDGNELAEGKDFFQLGNFEVSPDGRLLAYSTDFSGDERFTLRFKDLSTGQLLSDEITGTFYGGAWALDNNTFFYLTVDEAWRPHRVWRHTLGSAGPDELVYQEDDERFWTGVGLTRSQQYIVLDIGSKLTSEIRLIPADRPQETPVVFGAGRRQGVEMSIDHQGDRFLVLHNENAENFVLGWTPVTDTSQFHELIAHSADTRLEAADAFDGMAVIHFRKNGLTGLRLLPTGGEAYDMTFPEPIYTVGLGGNADYKLTQLRLGYTSMITPDSVYDYDLASRALLLRKQRPVLPGPDGKPYDSAGYEQHRLWATADDGTQVPISLVCKAGTPVDGTAGLQLYGYGSYESSMDPWFSIPRLSLLERGAVFAVAHVRGGGELGRRWYDEGKMLAKRNTFTDFNACARHLVKTGWTSAEKLVARGGSAGGLLMGAIANLAPDAYAGIVAQVPFVDPLTTILDPSLPLTVTEWEEWGNPLESPEVYAYMKSYSPYENVTNINYPPILAVTSLNDTRVRYTEPAKWVARLREVAPQGQYLLKTEMGAGHGGPSGRYDVWKEESFVNAWILDRIGLA
jgi:oligopeptidase B